VLLVKPDEPEFELVPGLEFVPEFEFEFGFVPEFEPRPVVAVTVVAVDAAAECATTAVATPVAETPIATAPTMLALARRMRRERAASRSFMISPIAVQVQDKRWRRGGRG
jgi:hypothetical protein